METANVMLPSETNPVAIENLKNITNENLRVRGNAYTELEFLKSFKYRFNFGFESSSDSYMNLRKIGNWTYNQPYDPSSLNRARGRSNSMVFDNTLEYNKTFGKHNISAVFGSSFMNNYYEKVWGN